MANDQLIHDSLNAHELRLLEQDFERVRNDLSGKTPLSDPHYKELMLGIKPRREHETLSEFFLSVHEGSEGLDKLSDSLDTPGLNALGDLAAIASSALKLFSFRRLGRKFNMGEKITIGLCIAAIVLSVASFGIGLDIFLGTSLAVLGIVLSVLVVGRAVISLARTWQNIRLKENQLEETELLAEQSTLELEQQFSDEKKAPSSSSEKTLKTLRGAVDQYIAKGFTIHRLREHLHHPRKVLTNRVHLAMGALAIIGAVFLFFPPVAIVGACLMGFAGIVSTGFVVGNWIHHRHEKHSIPLDRAKVIREALVSKTVDELKHDHTLKTPNEIRYAEIMSDFIRSKPVAPNQVVPEPIIALSTAKQLAGLNDRSDAAKSTPTAVLPEVRCCSSILSKPDATPAISDHGDGSNKENERP